MGYYNPDPYNQPEAFGLTILATIDRFEPNWDFDMVVVWWHEDGSIYWAQDSGCSCPSPFEEVSSMDDLTKLEGGWADLERQLLEIGGDSDYPVAVADVVRKVRELARG